MPFQPSRYSDYGQVAPSSGTSAAFKSASVSAGTVSTVTALSTAAAGSATVPVAGWVAAGVLGGAAGTVVLVSEIKKGKKNKAAAVKWAKQIGLENPESGARFLVKLATKDRKWRQGELKQQKNRLKRLTKSLSRRDTTGKRVLVGTGRAVSALYTLGLSEAALAASGRSTVGQIRKEIKEAEWKIETIQAYNRYLRTGSTSKQSVSRFRSGSVRQQRQIRRATGQAPMPPAVSPATGAVSPMTLALLGGTVVLLLGGFAYSRRG